MNIVFLDAKTVGDDIDLSPFHSLGNFTAYDFTSPEQVPERVADADIIMTNKVPINAQTAGAAVNLKYVCETATGINNLDIEYLASRNISWDNASGYSTDAVCQHTFAMLFYLLEKLPYYDDYVKSGSYSSGANFTHFSKYFTEIKGKTWGIIGLGAIGRHVADIASAFGANIIYYSASGRAAQAGYCQVDFDTLLKESDIISIHAPLNQHTNNLIDFVALKKMKSHCILLNVGRGGIINESDLRNALIEDQIAACGLDVMETEPLPADHPLLDIKDSSRLLITPHMAWASVEARTKLMDISYHNIKKFISSL